MAQKDIRLATALWELAERFNREEYPAIATELKFTYRDYFSNLSHSDQREVEEYIKSIGG